jgi:hypothetical protein
MARTGIALAVLILAAASVSAHHSYAGFYDARERTVTLEGTLEKITYANPHVVLEIRTADSTLYTVTWQSAMWVSRRAGVERETFRPGDHLVVVAAPSRDPASREVTMVREIRRPRDKWVFRDAGVFAAPSP